MDFGKKYRSGEFFDFLQHSFMPEDYMVFDEQINMDSNFRMITDIKKIGYSESLKVTVYEITHKSENDPRVTLTRETFKIMKNFGDYYSLAIFKTQNSDNYRFSYLTIGLKPDGRKINYELSNPRRYSFYLGPDAKVKTPEKFLVDRGRVKDLKDLEDRFSVEVVNKEFYKEIALRFTELVGGDREVGSGRRKEHFDPLLKLPGNPDHKVLQEFGVRTLGRVIFCWFLKKKKIPGRDEGLIPEEILSKGAVAQSEGSGKNYYHHILENLFFQVLNTPQKDRKEDFKRGLYSEIPFLNGGLFEPINMDFYKYDMATGVSKHSNTLIIPNEWFIELFDLLEIYNFTIDENTSFDTELSVDPEILGRIFENLLAEIVPETGESARRSTGSYYTPRPIVDYMVNESLKSYLKTKTEIDDKKLENLISYTKECDNLTPPEKVKILKALDVMKILDPACGSGAFPMGILQKSVWILQQVDPEGIGWIIKKIEKIQDTVKRNEIEKKLMAKDWDYVRKLGLIQSSIYGVDIQEIAVEIAKLRTFLSLIVDEKIDPGHENYGIEPLPNLEFKYVSANSLIGLPEIKKAVDKDNVFIGSDKESQLELFEDKNNIKKLKELRDSYFESYGDEKDRIKNEFVETQDEMFRKGISNNVLDDQTRLLSSWDPFSYKSSEWFDPEWMFGIKDGFDIVIGNPPYIQLQKALSDNENKKYADLYKNEDYKTFERTGDIYALFYEKGIQIIKNGGILTYITSNKWMRANYGRSLRKYLADLNPLVLIDLGPGVFSSATVDTNILIIEKARIANHNLNAVTLSNNNIELLKSEDFINLSDLSEESWIILSPEEQRIKQKIERIGTPLKDWDINIYRGVLTGYNEAFIIDGKKKDELIKEDPKSAEIIKPILRGRDIKRYKAEFADLWLINSHNGYKNTAGKRIPPIDITDYPAIKEHLDKYWNKLEKRQDKGVSPYNLRNCAYLDEFEKEKIVYNDISKKLTFALCKKGVYFNNTVYFITNSIFNTFLIGILNTKLIDWFYKRTSAQLGEAAVRLFSIYVENLPVIKIPRSQQKPFEILVNKIISKKEQGEETTSEEQKIDLMVYKLYGLTKEEIEIVDMGSR